MLLLLLTLYIDSSPGRTEQQIVVSLVLINDSLAAVCQRERKDEPLRETEVRLSLFQRIILNTAGVSDVCCKKQNLKNKNKMH